VAGVVLHAGQPCKEISALYYAPANEMVSMVRRFRVSELGAGTTHTTIGTRKINMSRSHRSAGCELAILTEPLGVIYPRYIFSLCHSRYSLAGRLSGSRGTVSCFPCEA
jgi:hypothetical protein